MARDPKNHKNRPARRKMTGSKVEGETRKRVTVKGDKDDATRMLHTKVKTASGRKISSKLWIERQINDPYVRRAKEKGYRSRAAFKLNELNDKFGLIKPGSLIVDLGCAPGGWVQIAMKRGADRVVGIDILPVDPIAGADLIEFDFMDEKAPGRIKALLGAEPDLVLSDLAANTTGHRQTDHLKTVALVEAAADFAMQSLRPGGHFVTKVFQGGAEKVLLNRLKRNFQKVQHAKPESSRKGSPEIYLVALNLQGRDE